MTNDFNLQQTEKKYLKDESDKISVKEQTKTKIFLTKQTFPNSNDIVEYKYKTIKTSFWLDV